MRVLVTGGAGYIGSHTIRYLKKAGYEVLVYDNLSQGYLQAVEGFDCIVGDIRDADKLRTIFQREKVGAVMHFAAHSQVSKSVNNPRIYYDNNVIGGLALINALFQSNVKYFIFSSSAAVYGEPNYVPIDEGHPLNPTNPYGETKRFLEKILFSYDAAYGLKSVSLRYFNAAGASESGEIGEEHDPETHLIPLILKSLLGQSNNLTIFGDNYPTRDGTPVRDYVHVEDLAEAHILALEYLLKGGRTDCFNLGNDTGFSVLEVIKEVENATGLKVPYKVGHRRMGDPAVLVASSRKIKEELGWAPRKSSLREIIGSAWKWHRGKRFNRG